MQSVKLWGTPRGRESASAYRLATQPLPPALSLPAMLSPHLPPVGGSLAVCGAVPCTPYPRKPPPPRRTLGSHCPLAVRILGAMTIFLVFALPQYVVYTARCFMKRRPEQQTLTDTHRNSQMVFFIFFKKNQHNEYDIMREHHIQHLVVHLTFMVFACVYLENFVLAFD